MNAITPYSLRVFVGSWGSLTLLLCLPPPALSLSAFCLFVCLCLSYYPFSLFRCLRELKDFFFFPFLTFRNEFALYITGEKTRGVIWECF